MPVFRYFAGVGGALLALLLIVNAYLPQTPVAAAVAGQQHFDRSTIRIISRQKGPERVVIDTSLPTIIPPAAQPQQVADATPPVTAPISASSREAFAQLPEPPAKPAAAPAKKYKPKISSRIARADAQRRLAAPRYAMLSQRPAPPPLFGNFFGSW
jgi:hypothetical protein